MQLHACFWDYSAFTRAHIGATRRMDYSRSFLASRAFDPCFPWQVVRDTLYPSIHKRVSKPAIYPYRERKDVWGRVLYLTDERSWPQRGDAQEVSALAGLRSS